MTTKDVANLCGVADRTVRSNALKAGVVLENGKSHDWTDKEIKRLQLVLTDNQINQGTQLETVKSNLETGFQVGLTFQEIVNSGNIEV